MNKAEKQVAAASLRDEATVIRQTRENYKEARANIEEKLKVLAEREQTKSVIWQRQYQQALKQQLDTAIDTLSKKNYSNIHQYLEGEYENGYIGTMYSLQKQGIPLVMPIDQTRVVKMVETTANDIKLSKRLYGNTTKLKNAVRREVSIGFASGESYQDVAARLSRTMDIDYNKTIRIARTEGGRVQNASRFEASVQAKKCGADIVKQWDSTLDNRTRWAHRELDGQVRELEEPFKAEGQEAQHPHGFGVPWMDVNCRCVVLQRARWAVEGEGYEDYTKYSRFADFEREKWLDGSLDATVQKHGGQIIDLSDARNFETFKANYKQVASNIVAQQAATAIGVSVMGQAVEKKPLVNANGETIKVNLEHFTPEQQEYVMERISVLSEKYPVHLLEISSNPRLMQNGFVVSGAVDPTGLIMQLRDPSAVDHEFLHAIDMSRRAKVGYESNAAFWKEAKKLFKEYKRASAENPNNLISYYSETSVDEFMAESFSVAVGGDSAGGGFGAKSPYVKKAKALVDKYFAK